MSMKTVAGPGSTKGAGFWPEDEFSQAIVGVTSVAVGDCMVIKTTTVNALHGLYDTIIEPVTGDLDEALFCIVLEAGTSAAASVVRVQTAGVVPALIVGTDAIGVGMAGTNAARGLTAAGTGNKIIAKMLEIGVAAALKRVWFDGINGFGTKAA